MAEGHVTKSVRATLCDLCGREVRADQPGESGSLTGGWLAHPVKAPRTKHAWLLWPPAERLRLMPWRDKQKPENKERRYDFHGECILRLVETNLHEATPDKDGA